VEAYNNNNILVFPFVKFSDVAEKGNAAASDVETRSSTIARSYFFVPLPALPKHVTATSVVALVRCRRRYYIIIFLPDRPAMWCDTSIVFLLCCEIRTGHAYIEWSFKRNNKVFFYKLQRCFQIGTGIGNHNDSMNIKNNSMLEKVFYR